MTSVKTKLRPSSIAAQPGSLIHLVRHHKVVRQIETDYQLYPNEWDDEEMAVRIPPDGPGHRISYLLSIQNTVRQDILCLANIVSQFEHFQKPYSPDDVVKRFLLIKSEGCFLSFARNLVAHLRTIGKPCTAASYNTSVNSFARFRKEWDIPLDEMDSALLAAYETYLKSSGVCPNSISFYMRNLRAIYNRAVDKKLTSQRKPFKHVYTGIEKTVKRAVTLKVIRQIKDSDLSNLPAIDFARDIFMFSFYTRGMSFIDIAYLKKKDLKSGVLSYRRQKTGQQLFIKWEKPMQEIIDKYDTGSSPYMLPIIKHTDVDERRQYKNAAHLVNVKLKKLGEKLGLSIPLTSYVARHAWASIAKSKNVPLSTISAALGHDSEKTTLIYLASLDTTAVDKANSQILKSL